MNWFTVILVLVSLSFVTSESTNNDINSIVFKTSTVDKLYPVLSIKVTSFDSSFGDYRSVWEMAQSEPSFSQWRRSDSSSEFRPKPHAKFPEKIQIEFTASGGHSYKATASLLWQQFNEHSTITAKTTINGTETFEHFVPVLRSYHGETSDGHPVSVVLHDEEGSFHMVIVTDEGHFTVEPHSRHENSISHSETRRALASAVKDTGLVLFFGKDVNEELYDSQPISDNNKLTREAIKRHIIPNSIKRNLRERRVVSKWAGCFPGADTNIYTITVGIAVNAGFYQVMGSSTANVLAIISEIFAAANVIYKTQVGVFLIVGPIDIRTTLDSDSTWNQIPSTSGTASCSGTIDTHLNGFTSWRAAKPKTETNAIWHLLTNCYPAPGTVGYAAVGVLCNSASGAGWSSYTTQTWLTVTHEIGHNFGAQHTFDLGGIMDYGDGTYLGEYQFYSPQNQNEICTQITSSMKTSTSSTRVPNCWKVYSPTCGNSNVEAGEDCDDTSACCSGCKFTSGSECSNHPCCTSCKFALPTTRCYQNTGYCANSTCVTSGCSQYSNVKPCGVTSSNPCLEGCVFDGSTTCSPATSISSLTRKYVPVGTVCSRSPYSTCQPSGTSGAVTCQAASSPTTYTWNAPAFGTCSVPCGTGTQTRTVTCINSSTSAVVADSFCTGTKPATSQSCTLTACAWVTGNFGTCSVTCGDGTQTRTVTCATNAGTGSTVADSYCTSTKPSTTQSCNNGACPVYAWNAAAYGTCSVPCGTGTQTRTVTCVNMAASNATVADSFCTGTKPATSQSCTLAACGWVTGDFGTCSVTCGAGTQTRTVTCATNGGTGSTVADSYCTTTKPSTTQSCNNGVCPVYAWNAPAFGACSVPCGTGTQTRTVTCVNTAASNATVADSFCTGTKPASSQSCTLTACGWFTGDFGTCSVTCGAGTQTRTVTCATNAGTGSTVADSYCTSTKPSTTQSCNNGVCPVYAWNAPAFGACSVPCGTGTQTRTVTCVNTAASNATVTDSFCTGTKPASSQSCTLTACGWVTGDFGSCSVTCGDGAQTRTVTCATNAGSGSTVADSYCTGTKPSTTQSCNNGVCPVYAWNAPAFGTCSVPCGTGTQTRTVTCVNVAASNATVSDSLCTGAKPATSQSCSFPVCGWFTGDFGACSLTCGGGNQTRTVECRTNAGAGVATLASYCTDSQPTTIQSCNTTPCPTYAWLPSAFNNCSVPCGTGTQTRTVTCVNTAASNTVVSDSLCTGTKPVTTQSCTLTVCGWFTGDFGTCSVTCGAGTQTRTVTCATNAGSGSTVADSYCTTTKPSTTQSCNKGACPVYAWNTPAFGTCSVPCGTGTQTRTVTCVNIAASNATVADSFCTGTKPVGSQSCTLAACGWVTGDFGSCSVTCGDGTQTRAVTCATNGGAGSTVADSYCTTTKPSTTQSCNNGACPVYAWNTAAFGACSVPCGTGTQTRTVTCVNMAASNATVSDSLCTGTKPSSSQSCTLTACGWFTGDFGACSLTCGGGNQTRTVECRVNAGAGATVADSYCTTTKPVTIQSCNTAACPTYSWLPSTFSNCSVPCGTGTQTRAVTCVNTAASNTVVSDSLCTGTKPVTSQSCTIASCDWNVGAFGGCSVTCGGGTQTRTVTCATNVGTGTTVADSYCTTTKPSSTQSCNNGVCPVYAWNAAAFGACLGSCGTGTQTRTVTCINTAASNATVADSLCTGTKPATSQTCSLPACITFTWFNSTWSDCSGVCNSGSQSRVVQCVASNNTLVADSACGSNKPAVTQTCSLPACFWTSGSWTSCNSQNGCGSGTQARNVTCVSPSSGSVVADSLCLVAVVGSKPTGSQTCSLPACVTYSWVGGSSSWSNCSSSCGAGVQTRDVYCVSSVQSVRVADSYCSGSTKPASSQACNVGTTCPSYYWFASASWSVCVAPNNCGAGTRSRLVYCLNSDTNTTVADSFCTGTRPSSLESCALPACVTYSWQYGSWSECVGVCIAGSQSRTVTCLASTGAAVNASYCSDSPLPSFQSCALNPCTWTSSDWSACTGSCGTGLQTRVVTCVDAKGAATSSAYCPSTTIPSSSATCTLPACSTNSWKVGVWSSCSAPCGVGSQSRTVTCVSAAGATLANSACTLAGAGPQPNATQSCNLGACSWKVGDWSACSSTCGAGTQTRTVTCVLPDLITPASSSSLCSGLPTYSTSQACTGTNCATPVDCSCTPWSAWSLCSGNCGGTGTQSSFRTCTQAKNGGRTCQSLGLTQTVRTQYCATQACPTDCSCGAWSAASPCSASCGGGVTTYNRTCIEATNGGRTCAQLGLSTKLTYTCNSFPCSTTPVNKDCSCTAWSDWSHCSRNCGTGAQYRTRTCTQATGTGRTCSQLGLTATVSARLCNMFLCTLPKSYIVSYFDFNVNVFSKVVFDTKGNSFMFLNEEPTAPAAAVISNGSSHGNGNSRRAETLQNLVPALRGNAASFSGSADSFSQLDLTNSNTLLYEVSISMWLNPSVAILDSTALISSNSSDLFVSFTTSSGKIVPTVTIGSSVVKATSTSSQALTPGAWNHFALTLSYTGDLAIYINGTLSSSASGVFLAQGYISPGTWSVACFAGQAKCYGGSVDELSVWSAALPSEDVSELYSRYLANIDLSADRNGNPDGGDSGAGNASGGGSSILPAIIGAVAGVAILIIIIVVVVVSRRGKKRVNYAVRKKSESGDEILDYNDHNSGSVDNLFNTSNNKKRQHQQQHHMSINVTPVQTNVLAMSYPSEKKSKHSPAAPTTTTTTAFAKPEVGALFQAIYNYQAHQADELDLSVGDIIHVTSQSDDGWMLGKNMRTKRHGVCPGNYLSRVDVNDGGSVSTVKGNDALSALASQPSTTTSVQNPLFSESDLPAAPAKPTKPIPPTKPTPPTKPAPLAPLATATASATVTAVTPVATSTPPPKAAKPTIPAKPSKPILNFTNENEYEDDSTTSSSSSSSSSSSVPPAKPSLPPAKPALPTGKPTPPPGKPTNNSAKPALPPGKPSLNK